MGDIKRPVFRTAMGGYNKKDVNQYIAGLSKRFDDQITLGESQLAASSSYAKELETKLQALEAELNKPNEAETLRTEMKELCEEFAKLQAISDARANQIDALITERDDLKERLSDTQTKLSMFVGMQEKLADYENMKAKMGDLYLEAVAGAERIKSEAEEYATTLRAETEAELDAERDAQFERISNMLENMRGELLTIIDNYHSRAAEIASCGAKISQNEDAKDGAVCTDASIEKELEALPSEDTQ